LETLPSAGSASPEPPSTAVSPLVESCASAFPPCESAPASPLPVTTVPSGPPSELEGVEDSVPHAMRKQASAPPRGNDAKRLRDTARHRVIAHAPQSQVQRSTLPHGREPMAPVHDRFPFVAARDPNEARGQDLSRHRRLPRCSKWQLQLHRVRRSANNEPAVHAGDAGRPRASRMRASTASHESPPVSSSRSDKICVCQSGILRTRGRSSRERKRLRASSARWTPPSRLETRRVSGTKFFTTTGTRSLACPAARRQRALGVAPQVEPNATSASTPIEPPWTRASWPLRPPWGRPASEASPASAAFAARGASSSERGGPPLSVAFLHPAGGACAPVRAWVQRPQVDWAVAAGARRSAGQAACLRAGGRDRPALVP
jgi:hypothetical protein